MAGIRLGMAFASEEIISLFNKVKPPYNINVLTQKTALKGMSNTKEVYKNVNTILEERARLEELLPDYSFVQKVYPVSYTHLTLPTILLV